MCSNTLKEVTVVQEHEYVLKLQSFACKLFVISIDSRTTCLTHTQNMFLQASVAMGWLVWNNQCSSNTYSCYFWNIWRFFSILLDQMWSGKKKKWLWRQLWFKVKPWLFGLSSSFSVCWANVSCVGHGCLQSWDLSSSQIRSVLFG